MCGEVGKKVMDDFTGEISSELEQLISLSEILRGMEDPDGLRENFFCGLAEMIAGAADRINSMLEPTYNHLHQQGKTWTFDKIRGQAEGQILCRLSKRWILRERADFQTFAGHIKKKGEEKKIKPNDMISVSEGVEAFAICVFDHLERNEITFDSLSHGDLPAAPWA